MSGDNGTRSSHPDSDPPSWDRRVSQLELLVGRDPAPARDDPGAGLLKVVADLHGIKKGIDRLYRLLAWGGLVMGGTLLALAAGTAYHWVTTLHHF